MDGAVFQGFALDIPRSLESSQNSLDSQSAEHANWHSIDFPTFPNIVNFDVRNLSQTFLSIYFF